jgi:hypothetical protein
VLADLQTRRPIGQRGNPSRSGGVLPLTVRDATGQMSRPVEHAPRGSTQTIHPAAQLAACSRSAGIAWLSEWSLLQLTGRRASLEAALRQLGRRYTRYGSAGALDHGWLHRVGPNQALLLSRSQAGLWKRVYSAVRPLSDLVVIDVSLEYEAFAVAGPAADVVAESLFGNRALVIIRSVEIDYLVVSPKAQAPATWRRLLRAGAQCGAHPVSPRSIALLAAARKIVDCQRPGHWSVPSVCSVDGDGSLGHESLADVRSRREVRSS